MLAVIDTNILVSALWSKNGAPAQVLSLIISGRIKPCFDYRIMTEYRDVLQRPKFKFSPSEVNALLDWFTENGQLVIAEPLALDFIDQADKKFYEVAKYCQASLITGNIKHFPVDDLVCTVTDFLNQRLF